MREADILPCIESFTKPNALKHSSHGTFSLLTGRKQLHTTPFTGGFLESDYQ